MVELYLDDSLVDLYEENGITLNIFNSDVDKFVSPEQYFFHLFLNFSVHK